MNSFLRRTVPAALLAGGAMMVATAGAAGAQVPVPGAGGGLPTGGVDSLSGAPSALCSGPLSALSGLSGVCEVAGEDNVEVGSPGQVLPQAATQDSQESADEQYPVNVQLNGDHEEPEAEDGPGNCYGEPEDCDVPEEEPCEACPTTTETTVPQQETTVPPSSETTVTTAPPTTQVAAMPPAEEELPRTGSTVAPFVVAGAALVAVGIALVASRRFALARRG